MITNRNYLLSKILNEGEWGLLKDASKQLRDDKEIIMLSVEKNGLALEFASERLKDDKDVISKAIENDPLALEFASERLKNDKDVAIKAIKKYTFSLEFLSDELKNNKEIIMLSIKQSGLALEFASEKLKKDKDVVATAVSQNFYALKFASSDLSNNYKIVYSILENDITFFKKIPESEICKVLELAPNALLNDKKFSKLVVKKDGLLLRFLSDNMKDCKDVVIDAVKQNSNAIQFISENLKNDFEILNIVLRDNIEYINKLSKSKVLEILKLAPAELLNNYEFCLSAVKINGLALQFLPKMYQEDANIAIGAIRENIKSIHYLSVNFICSDLMIKKIQDSNLIENVLIELSDNKEVAKKYLTIRGSLIKFLSDNLKNDKEIAFIAICKNPYAFDYVSNELKCDKEIITYYESQLKFHESMLRSLWLNEISYLGFNMYEAPNKLKEDENFCIEAIKLNKDAFKFTLEKHRNNPEFVLKIININIDLLDDAPAHLLNNKEFVLKALKINKKAIDYIHGSLKNDIDVLEIIKE